jgi:hypothetical protein
MSTEKKKKMTKKERKEKAAARMAETRKEGKLKSGRKHGDKSRYFSNDSFALSEVSFLSKHL